MVNSSFNSPDTSLFLVLNRLLDVVLAAKRRAAIEKARALEEKLLKIYSRQPQRPGENVLFRWVRVVGDGGWGCSLGCCSLPVTLPCACRACYVPA